jgi:hypothetical protein
MNPLDFLINSAKKIVNTGKSAVSNFISAPDNSTSGIIKNTITGTLTTPGRISRTINQKVIESLTPRKEAVPIRPAFQRDYTMSKLPPAITTLGGIGNSIVESIVRTPAQLKATFTGKDVSLPFDPRRVGIQTEKVQPTQVKFQNEVDRLNTVQPPKTTGDVYKNRAFALATTVLPDVLDVLVFGDILTGSAKFVLNKTGYSKALGIAPNKLVGLTDDEAIAFVKERANTEAAKIIQANTKNGVITPNGVSLLNNLQAEINTLAGAKNAGVKLNKLGETLQDTSAKLTSDIKNLNRPLGPNISREVPFEQTLPGYRATPGQAPAFGLSTQKVEPVGFGAKKDYVAELKALEKSPDPKIARDAKILSGNLSLEVATKYQQTIAKAMVESITPKNVIKQALEKSKLTGEKVGQITPDMKVNIIRAIDDYRLNKGNDVALQADLSTMAEDLGVAPTKNYGDLVNKMEDVLAKSDQKTVLQKPSPLDTVTKKPVQQGIFQLPQKVNSNVSLPNNSTNSGIVQKAKDYWKNLPNKQGGFVRPFSDKKLSEVDRLIAEGKIRVKSKNGRDVYEYKKGNIWQTARDESSAVAQVTKPKVSQATELPPEVIEAKIALEIKKEVIANSRFANPDNRFLVDREGRVRELGDTTGKLSQKIEDMMVKANVTNPKDLVAGVEELFKQKESIKIQTEAVKEMEKVAKEKLAMEKMKLKSPISTIISGRPKPQPSKIDTTEGEGRSIELQAQQALQVLESGDVPVDVSFPSIIEKTVTNVKEKVHIIDTFLRTPKYVMEKIGFGKEAQELRDAMDEYWKELPKNIDKITQWSKRASKGSNVDIFRYLDGEAITLLPEDKAIAQEIQAYLQNWAKRLKLPQDKKVSHYITHIFDEEFIAKEFDEDLAKIIADKIPGQVYDPFLEKRLGAKGYRQDTWAALDAYVKRGTRKVHMDPVLNEIKARTGGSLDMSNIEKSQFEYIQKYINNINLRPNEMEEGIDNFVKSIIGYKMGQRPTTRALKIFRQFTFRGMLGLNPASALRNLSQGANTFAVLGSKNTTLGYLGLFKKGATAELEREGVLNAGFVQDRALTAGKKVLENFDKTLFYMFETAEKINRGAAYFGAKAEAISQGKTEAEAIKYAKEIVRKTQFSFDVIDTPVGMSSDIVKTLLQFQTFTTKQIEFLGGMARRAATGDEKAKNFMGLLRYGFAGLLFAYTIGKAFGMEPSELLPWYRFQVPASLKFPTALTGALLNTPDKFGNERTTSEKVKDVAESAIGLIPAGSQMKKTYQGTKAVMEGGSYDASGKMQFEQAEGWPAKIQAILFGKYAQQNAKEYFDRVEINAEEKAKVQPVYDQVQKLNSEGKQEEALSMVNDLSEEEYAIYKKIKTAEKAKATIDGKKKVLPIYNQAQKLKTDGKEAEAKVLVDSLNDQEYEYYKAVKKDKEALEKAQDGEKPEFGEVQSNDSVIKTVWTYAKAIGVDPVTAFNRIFTGQRIRYVANDAVVVERMSLQESQAIKEKWGGATPEMKLDHTIPLQLGGSNDEDNLRLVPTDEWATYTPVENAIGQALRNKKISKDEAQKIIKDFKDGKITSEDVYLKLK